jgi:hypothetical protein
MTAGILAVGVAVAGCGSASSRPGVATLSTSTSSAGTLAGSSTHATGLLAYAACVRAHGVPSFPDPGPKGEIPKSLVVAAAREVGNSQLTAAQNACNDLLPSGGSLSGQASRTVTAQQQQYYLKAAACMRSRGITNFPDPSFSKGNVEFAIPSSDTHSTQFTQAVRSCEKLIPSGLPYSGSKR